MFNKILSIVASANNFKMAASLALSFFVYLKTDNDGHYIEIVSLYLNKHLINLINNK